MYFHHLGTRVCISIVGRNFDISIASCHSMYAHSPLLLEVSAHFPLIKQYYQTIFFSLINNVFMNATVLRHVMTLLEHEKNLLAHCQVSQSYMTYDTNDIRCLLPSPVITLVSKSAKLSYDFICPVNGSSTATDSWMV